LLIGDPGVGKTSLIYSLVSEEFPESESIPPRCHDIIIPPDVTPENVPTHIIDYSERDGDAEPLASELRRADVLVLVYAADDDETLTRVSEHWLPLVRRECGDAKPLILAGNKVDLVDYSTMEQGFSLMVEYPQIETCVECSAATLRNISELFYYAQKAVLHPTTPLYRIESKDLTDECKQALTRIFQISDIDCDGVLNDTEVQAFQYRCFQQHLDPNMLIELKQKIGRNCAEGLSQDGITMRGFHFLHRFFIQNGRHETTWAVLRKFGYTDQLTLPSNYLTPPLKVPSGCSAELNYAGHQFLTDLMKRYDLDRDGSLSHQELANLFETCPKVPWGEEVYTTVRNSRRGHISLASFLAMWTMWTYTDVDKTLEHLAYLGFCEMTSQPSQLAAITVTREKKLDLAKKASQRNVHTCHVIGAIGAGKTSLCQGLIGKGPVSYTAEGKLLPTSSVTIDMQPVYGQEKYLIMRDIDVTSQMLLEPHHVNCDVVALVYDSSDPESFQHIARVYLKYFSEAQDIPVLVIAAKSDLGSVTQNYLCQPAQFCQNNRLSPPYSYTNKSLGRSEIYSKLATMAAYPRYKPAWMLFYKTGYMQQLRQMPWLQYGVGAAALLAFVMIVTKAQR